MARMSTEDLAAIWEALQRTRVPGSHHQAHRHARELALAEWVYLPDLEDLLLAFDDRLFGVPLEPILAYLDIPKRIAFPRPRFVNSETGGFEAITACDVASVLIFAQQFGFRVDPSRMVDLLLPTLDGNSRLTLSELEVFRYKRYAGRECLEIRAEGGGPGRPEQHKFVTDTGRKLEGIFVDGQLMSLKTKGPMYRKRPAPTLVQCDYCQLEYLRGEIESSLSHRSYHAQVSRVVDPRPLRKMMACLDVEQDPELVRHSSPVWKHREMLAWARQFRREMHFDFVQWGCNRRGKEDDEDARGCLFSENTEQHPRGTIVGACAFRWREDHWGLQWIWVTPSARRTGVLTRRWARFLEQFGDFEVEAPVSEAMQAFLLRHGTASQRQALGLEATLQASD